MPSPSLSLEAQVKRQVEFYFSDSNFRRDRFLKEETTKQQDGFIPFSVLFTFKKLQALTTDPAVLQKSIENSDLLEMNESKDALRRKSPLPEVDDSPERTLVFVGLGAVMPTIDEIKKSFEKMKVTPLYISRNNASFERFRNGMVQVEFETKGQMEEVEKNAKEVSIQGYRPQMMQLAKYKLLSQDDKKEFQKNVVAMLIAKQVPVKERSEIMEALSIIWTKDNKLRPRVKYIPETQELYLMFTQVAMAKSFMKMSKETPIVIDETKLSFELVTDTKTILARPRPQQQLSGNKRQRDDANTDLGKTICITNLASGVRLDDIKTLLSSVVEENQRPPYVTYTGLSDASFVIKNTEKAVAMYEKLCALSDEAVTLHGQKAEFSLMDPNEEHTVQVTYTNGLLVHFEGINGDGMCRDDIKKSINEALGHADEEKHPPLAYIQYQTGDASGNLRFTSAEAANKAVKLITSEGVQINESQTLSQARLLDGEDEKKFWEELHAYRHKRFADLHKKKKNFRDGKYRGRK
uniref:Uncharacterized protein AlNc14C155G7618 n=1 Tax=Albugo laibachii Nc14 TaxID=890382 RepID=F0WMB3_9STRA|nr:conserved hypothetical protein [Albugo laibachii Nc14]|eukprot:CCA22444.1 conserved hypothetical protein [Albugo laibachii Nc14]